MSFRSLSGSVGVSLSLAFGLSACSGNVGDESTNSTTKQALASESTFIVLYHHSRLPSSVGADIERAGGTLAASYPAIGVAIARSSDSGFVDAMSSNRGVEGVAPTTGAGAASLPSRFPDHKLPPPAPPASSSEPLAGLQWNMNQIHAAEARAVTPGRKSVVVGVLDSGIDDKVEDLQGQVDHARSATCIGGVANADPAVWSFDGIGHGTHVAGIIGAKEDGVGVVGVAPGATLAAVKLTDDGFVYPEAFICGMDWAVNHGFDIVNASIFIDPWYYTCRSDPSQRVIWTAVQRAVKHAVHHGISVVVAASNENQDLAHPTTDPFSPTDGPSVPREIDNRCELLPVELNGVIGVSATAGDGKLSYYSNYGFGVIDLTAPGGDLHVPVPGNESGQIVSDIPSYSFYYQAASQWNGRIGVGCTDGLDPNDPNADPSTCAETYALLQGTSVSAPHVAGVAALAMSRFGHMDPAELMMRLANAATPIACPTNPYQPYPADMPAETCEGGRFYNGFYGRGEVDAFRTVRPRFWW